MSTLTGQTVSHYKILEQLGGGGMGVVYRALDTRLDRVVALKFLSEQPGTTLNDRERFIREARLAAALNHPNIATVFEIHAEEPGAVHPGQMFIAMEFVEGKTLREMIDSGPLKIDEAIRIVVQAAEGLHAAHERGVVHRDVKSANIMVTPKGQVKLMDFGLAKFAQGRTMITSAGSTLGTFAYMSPEQAKGEGVDLRTDIWGLGVVLYEMITGSLPFRGDYPNAVVYAILNEQPAPPTAVRTGVPPALDSIVSKMLAKDPGERYQHVEEIPVDLRNVRSQTEPRMAVPGQVSAPAHAAGAKWLWAAGWLALGAAATAIVLQLLRPPAGAVGAQTQVARFSITLPDSTPIAPIGSAPLGIGQPSVAVSPDGSLVAVVVQSSSGPVIQLRSMNRYEYVRLHGTERAYFPFFSPNSRWLGFFAGNQLRKISVDGGAAVTLCEAINPRGAVWADDDRIYFSDKEGSRFSWVQSSGGIPAEIKNATGKGFGGFEFPAMLPGDRALVGHTRAGLELISLDGPGGKMLNVEGSSPRYLNTGHLLFYSVGNLFAASFDPERQELTGTPIPIIDGVLADASHPVAHMGISRDGTLVYVPGKTEVESRLVMVDRRGGKTVLPFPPALFETFQLSPDGKHLVILNRVLGPDIWIYDLQQGSRTRVTTDGMSGYPIWSPDGKWILYSSGVRGRGQVVRELADGSGKREVLERAGANAPYSLSPDGRCLAVSGADSATANDVKVIDLLSAAAPVVVAGTAASEWGPSFSRDGKYIAYVSDESGQYEVYVQPFPLDARRWQVSTEGGEEPIWSGTGNELFYRRGLEWVAVEVATSGGFIMKKSRVVISGDYVNVGGRSFDVTRDGTRFLVLERLDKDVRLTEIRVVTNWFREVEGKVKGR